MGGSCWRTSVTCSRGDSRVCNSVKTKHKISTAPVKQRWLACLAGGNGDSPGDGKHLTWWSIFPAASAQYHLGLFLLTRLALTFSKHYTFFLIPSTPAVHKGKSLCLNAVFAAPKVKPSCSVSYMPTGLLLPCSPCTTALHFSTETTGFWKTPSSCLLPFRGSPATYKISPFSMQIVTATLTLASLQQQTPCHCKSIEFSESV